ncbi:pyridoxamine 5'-phosphate oxidase family protein [Propionicimonas sp.]|uniref:pyridoxamine 5'-phosphate oxidase family protein n=1 Tax=Propionicimonas sp. TaxID=1955623 RepID=UPI0017DD6D1B|nr:pyridoxamine 5'-phosphate oxidase family protein [Propionicimonas sp.]MBU3976487.1 pyridoxamine 5'-phosphate oxidase family protein [Actinomycetota bacterium]MBA3020327.1 pyridoxamine 5'-phosphate oxidase family protein [Propionicimonas sp.]MBU3987319.1 pyridoxamine 5'-phosphate oxidase family protein [Actinomycetota bacterium]MBU4007631.1 pyridoxamine 5'-phosphate oxidase family protein [Actinomycetota bacterium]MBU4064412.1 pyridoxamine 5'-phosphate oxidase family protein [Actinomycetota 
MTPRNLTPSREADRLRSDRAALDQLLDEVLVGYVAISLPEGPLALPVSYARDGDRVLFHGSTGSRRMRALAEGAEVCFTVAAADGLKVGRTAFGTGMQFRSATLFGTCELVEGAGKVAALGLYTDRYLPGRMAEVRPITAREAAATMLLALPITQWSMKVAEGFAHDDFDEVAGEVWAGVVPWFQGVGEPVSNPDLPAGIGVPDSVKALYRQP